MAGGARRGRVFGEPAGSLVAAVAAEVIGTFLLVFAGAGAVVVTAQADPGAPLDTVPIALAFGFAVLVAVYAFGHVSGAHINPSVTVGLAAARRFPLAVVPAYLAAQFAGAVLAGLALLALFGSQATEAPFLLGSTQPGDGVSGGTVVLAETIITFLLLVVVLATATDERAETPAVGLGVGLVIAAGIFVTLPISGGSFNTARSLGPMIVAGEFPAWGAYVVGPLLGGVLGALTYDLVLRRGTPPEPAGAVEEKPKQ